MMAFIKRQNRRERNEEITGAFNGYNYDDNYDDVADDSLW